ncbi:hypothetical protein [Mesorhizobium sp. f-mel]
MLDDRIYTLDEAAEYLRMTRRGVIKIAKRHGLCMVNGRIFTFTADDIEGIKRAMRPDPNGAPVGRLTTPAVRYALPGTRLYDLTVKAKLERQARKEADRIRNASARQEGRELVAELKRQERANKRAAKASQAAPEPEPLDYANRDPNYWRAARKRRLQAERNANGGGT